MDRWWRRPDVVQVNAWPRLATVLVSIAILVGGCAPANPAPTAAPATPEPPVAVISPAPGVTASPTEPAQAAPTQTPSPTTVVPPSDVPASPSAPAPTPTPSPTPTAPAAPTETVVDAYAWLFDKHPMALSGGAGTTRFTRVLFGAKTVDLRWKANGAGAACAFAARVESPAMAKPVTVRAKVKAAKPAAGTRSLAANYGDAVITVRTDCAKWSIKGVSTGHPGVIIKQATRHFTVTGDTAAAVKAGLDDAHLDWWINYSYFYRTPPLRLTSIKTSVRLVANLPAWTPPATASTTLVAEWRASIAAMRTHQAGDAVIAIQAAGRFQAVAGKRTRYRSPTAMQDAIERRCSKAIETAQDRTNEYDIFTRRGFTQGVDIG